MKIEGYSDDQLAALCEVWNLGNPIDVLDFLGRTDIPKDAKERVRAAGTDTAGALSAECYQLMQAQILIEVAALDKQTRRPFTAKGE